MNARSQGRMPPAIVPESVVEDLARRFTAYTAPEASAAPLGAIPFVTSNGLPPKPGRDQPQSLQDAWNCAFNKPPRLLPFEVSADRIHKAEFRSMARQAASSPRSRHHHKPRTHHEGEPRGTLPQAAFSRGFGHHEASSNWSGAYVSATEGRRLTQVWGFWTIPSDLRRVTDDAAVECQCANWIGFDGQRRYVDSSLPQIGTTSILHPDGTISALAWTQWWARRDPLTAPVPLGLPVEPGHKVACVLSAIGPHDVVGVMVNLGTDPPTAMVFKGSAPTVTLEDGRTTRPEVFGATAEWILERPQRLGETRRYDLPDFGIFQFKSCLAVATGAACAGPKPVSSVQDLANARLIRMVDIRAEPDRTAIIARPERLDHATVRVRHGGF